MYLYTYFSSIIRLGCILGVVSIAFLFSDFSRASTPEFTFTLPIDGELKNDLNLYATDIVGVGVPWTPAFDHSSNIGKDSTTYFPESDFKTDRWPAVSFTNNVHVPIVLENSRTGHKMTVEMRLNKAKIRFGTSNYGFDYGLGNCKHYENSYQGVYNVYLPDNDTCYMPINTYDHPEYGKISSRTLAIEIFSIEAELVVPKGQYYSGVYSTTEYFRYGPSGSGHVMTFNSHDTYLDVEGELTFSVNLEVPDRFGVEAEVKHIELQDRLGIWLVTGNAPKTLEGETLITFFSNRQEFRFWYTCEFKTAQGKCAIQNEKDDLLELDVSLTPPDSLGDILPTPSNYNIEIDTVYESKVSNELHAQTLKQKTNLKINTSLGESERIYKNHPGTSYNGQLHIYIDALVN
ncbi:hypothetical protein VCRA2120O333_40043 [Vibrio crassostreae]|nr:hypothetical protein VCRA2121O334_40313 [Vibrio crassostreae]CAK3515181.1 hypothetical protein VCRA2122O341_30004 [Vibrio crassostreae]CAK3912340.1 hypothetical protein VCRA2120O333_40043 [Vibrio crassostreae]